MYHVLFFSGDTHNRFLPWVHLKVDHVGVSNAQLVVEGSRLARIYKSQSVAEQNSGKWGRKLPYFNDSLRTMPTSIILHSSE
jgi:hypothetical protein